MRSRNSTLALAVSMALTLQATTGKAEPELKEWQRKVIEYAAILENITWTPVADTMPKKGDTPKNDKVYRDYYAVNYYALDKKHKGAPYSNGGYDGRMIGHDIFLKTYLAAVENPESVLYTTDLRGQAVNAAAFYGTVCSALASYSLQLGTQVISSYYGKPYREGVELAEPQTAQGAQVGDVLWNRGHVAMVTGITRGDDGKTTHVRVSESVAPLVTVHNYTAEEFDSRMIQRKSILYRITDHDLWRGNNRAEQHLFPDYEADANIPSINRTLLLDLGDWVVYNRGQPVKINIMDKDSKGVKKLVVRHKGKVIEEVALPGSQIVERSFEGCGDYTAHCIMADGSDSQKCEFSVSFFDMAVEPERIIAGKSWDVSFTSENIEVIDIYLTKAGRIDYDQPFTPYTIHLNDKDRAKGRVTIPAAALPQAGDYTLRLTGENKYGRIKKRMTVSATTQQN